MITSPNNATIKAIRHLVRSKGDRALVEGPHLVGEAIAAGLAIETLLATPEALASREGAAIARRAEIEPTRVAAEVLERLADADSPRGLAAVVHLPRLAIGEIPREAGRPYLYLDGLQEPGNLGAVARAAEAAGAVALALGPGCAHPNHPRALRASAGSLLRLAVASVSSVAALADHLAPLEPTLVALTPRGGTDLYAAELAGTPILLLGAEGQGLSAETERRSDLRLTIPLAPPVESLNVAVAAALVLFEWRRRQERL